MEIEVNGAAAKLLFEKNMAVTTGMVGLQVHFNFSEEFDALKKTALVSGSGVFVEVPVAEDDTILVPTECLAEPGGLVKIGIYATNNLASFGKAVRLPTTWADAGIIYQGTFPIALQEDEDEVKNELSG
jgi:hypothetical protein